MARLSHVVALVTGGASGLGKAIAQRLAADGARVVIGDVQVALGKEVAADCGFDFFQQDVCDEARWLEIVREIEARHERLNVLVNNAGIVGPTDAVTPLDTRLEDWRKIFAVNVDGVFLGCRSVIPAMRRAGGGSIVNIASIAGMLATPDATAYGASKAAVRQLTKSVAQYCAQERLKIRCNSVHPGIVRTALWTSHAVQTAAVRQVPLEQIVAEGASSVPLGDFTQPEDVAAAVSFLASEDSRHMTGDRLVVDGGIVGCDTYQETKPA